jgi:hypothetical protein
MFLVPLLDARRYFLELLQVPTDGCGCSIERFPIFGFVSVRVAL